MLKQEKIVHSQSPARTPILFVSKSHSRLHLYINYRQWNKLTILNKYPLPLISKLRDRVVGATIFSKINLQDGYHLIHIRAGNE